MEWYVFALLSAFFVALSWILKKKALFKEHVAEFLVSFYLINLLIVLPFFGRVNFNHTFQLYLIIFTASFIGASSLLLLAKSYRHLEISEVSPLTNLSPLILVFIAFMFLGEIPSALQFLGIFLIMAGAYSLGIDYKHKDFFRPFKIFKGKYYMYVLLAMIGYSITAALDKVILAKADYFSYYFITRFFFLAILFTYHSAFYDGYKGVRKGITNQGRLILVTVLLTIAGTLLYLKALSLTLVSLVIPIKRVSTLIAVVIGGELFHDHGLVRRIIACIIMIIGAALIII